MAAAPAASWQPLCLLMAAALAGQPLALLAQSSDSELARWLVPQAWTHDTDSPVISLGPEGAFDDQHIFAPCVARESDRFLLWYCGSRGTVEDRVFGLGLATASDGRIFQRHSDNPVLTFADGRCSILTPTLLAANDGTPIRENGKLRLWFSSTDFHDRSGLHTLHESTRTDAVHWSLPSPALLRDVYAPSILKD